MNTPSIPSADASERRQHLTDEVRTYASAARAELLHPVRVRNVIACGKALAELRTLLGYGQWTGWIETQCGLNRMTANRYMRLARRTDRLKWQMTIREAYLAAGVITAKPAGSAPDSQS